MLELKNIIEDIVMDAIENLDESLNGDIDKNQKIELASYVLNRIKPMYITSNKGFTNIIVKYQNDPQFFADILIRVNDGLSIVKKTDISKIKSDKLNFDVPYYFLPKIYGKIISSKTLSHIDKAKVSLYIDLKLARELYTDWTNPLELNENDKGVFSFAPMPIEASTSNGQKVFQLKFAIEKGDKTHEKFMNYETNPVFIQNLEIDLKENVLQIDDIYVPF